MSCLVNEADIIASITKESFEDFCKEFWEEVPGAGNAVWNWHMTLMCQTLQDMAERVFKNKPRNHDCIFNVSPGTSKSTLASILFPAWVWTRMPNARIISASHTDTLVLDLSVKSRYVMLSDKYRQCFPDVVFRKDQDTKGYYGNTLGGDRFCCTVAGKSPMGMHAHFILIDDPIDPKKALSQAEIEAAKQFFDAVIPSRKVDKEVTVTFLIMQRLHEEDPTGHLLEKSRRDGAVPILHICLPAELDPDGEGGWKAANTTPAELASFYVDGLMDPKRLTRKVLRERRTDGLYSYTGQYLQSPTPLGGGMFKEESFSLRIPAAPYRANRVRFWDRAATSNDGCYTAGVLMSRDSDDWYNVEHCIHGQWEPFERNDKIIACALADRARYGPLYEPVIYIERERGSTGEESFRHIARRLAGFKIKEYAPTGSKEVRAEPWSDQVNAKNVRLVEDGTWDINNYIKEHKLFPKGKYKDQVDASAAAFLILAEQRMRVPFRAITFSKSQKSLFKLVVCSKQDMGSLIITDHNCLLISITNPEPLNDDNIPAHGITKLLATLKMYFADLEPKDFQNTWNEIISPYNKKVEELILTQAKGKELWKFLKKSHSPNPECIVIQDEDDNRGISLAYALCDSMGHKRSSTVYRVAEPDNKNEDKAPNQHIYEMVKLSRNLVI